MASLRLLDAEQKQIVSSSIFCVSVSTAHQMLAQQGLDVMEIYHTYGVLTVNEGKMFIKTLDDLVPGKGIIRTASWASYRLLHREDGMGVTLTDAVLEPGLHQTWWYKNHLEAVYCLEGEGVLEDLATGQLHEIKSGTLYALDKARSASPAR